MPLFRSVVLPLLASALLLAAAAAVWRLGTASPAERVHTLARSLARQTIERELARLGSSKEGEARDAAETAERQRLEALASEAGPAVRTPALTGTEERCERCHANSAVCGLSHPRELARAIRRGEPRERVRERFCATEAKLDAAVALVDALCAPQPSEWRDCEEDPELSDALDEAAIEYCGSGGRKLFCPEDGPEALLREAAALLPPQAWARTHPGFGQLVGGKHPIEVFGCAGCHEPATLSPEVHGPNPVLPAELRRSGPTKGVAIRNAFEDFTRFARGDMFDPLAGVEARTAARHEVLARCAACHAPAEAPLPGAEGLWDAHQLLSELGCQGCHGGSGEPEAKIGPPLRQLGQKLRPGYLLEWLRNPLALRPRGRMPSFWPASVSDAVREREVRVIATWLLLGADGVQLADPPEGDASRGETLFDEIGCRGCHALDSGGSRPLASSADRDFAPTLGDAGDRLRPGWTYFWLKDPQAWWPDARMPNLRLSDRDAADLTAFLMERRSGTEYPDALGTTEADAAAAPALVERYGCDGCHDVPGLARRKPIAAGLESSALRQGQVTHAQWRSWTDAKLRDPRAPMDQPGDFRMPDYGLSDAEVETLLLALRSLTPPRAPDEYVAETSRRRRALAEGERLVNRFGCRNCHTIGRESGRILDRYEDPELAAFAPPRLDGLAGRTRRAWLAGYLRAPEPLRPWLVLRMPTFPLTNAEAEALVQWFEAREAEPPGAVREPPMPDADTREQGRELVRTLDCLGCHPAPGSAPDRPFETLGPDLALAAKRLRPDWIARWLADPQQVQPGTRMPSYFVAQPGGQLTSPAPHLFDGDPERQLEVLQQLLVHGAVREE